MSDQRDGVLRRVARVVVRLVYRRVDILHADRLTTPGPMLVVANHFGGVADAVLVVLASSRRPRIVAADRIWKIPLVGRVLDAIGAIPIHQRRDGASGNQDAFASCHRALAEGSQILIFPEGVTSEEPSIAQVRTGAARIVLGARAAGVEGIAIVPVGIHYEDKAGFRSRVFVEVGEAFGPDSVIGPDAGADDRAAVDRLTDEIAQRLRRTAPDFRGWAEERALVTVAEAALRDLGPDPDTPIPLDLEYRVANGLARLEAGRRDPLVRAAGTYHDVMEPVGLRDRDIAGRDRRRLGPRVAFEVALTLLMIPYALAGLVANAVPLALLAVLRRVVSAPAVMATVLPLAAAGLFGLTWAFWLWWAWSYGGWESVVWAATILPVLLAALLATTERLALGWRAATGLVTGRRSRAHAMNDLREDTLDALVDALAPAPIGSAALGGEGR